MPMAARRSPKGSFVLVGTMPAANNPARESSRSAKASASPGFVSGNGLVLLADGLRHLGGLAVPPGILAPHDALQRGHLDHHFGHQVGLGQVGSPPGVNGLIRRQAEHGDQFTHQLLDAVGFIQHRAEFLLEYQRAQARAEILQLMLSNLPRTKKLASAKRARTTCSLPCRTRSMPSESPFLTLR